MAQSAIDFLHRFVALARRRERGQTLVEYGLLLAFIAIVVIVVLIWLGPLVSTIFSNVGNALD